MDNLTTGQRKLCMSKIRSKNTQPEIKVKRLLSRLGVSYRKYDSKLPGNPDIVIPSSRKIIFVNGCFWHQHKNCKKQAVPKVNKKYWLEKLKRNIDRLEGDIKELRKAGWHIYKIWECQTTNENKLAQRVLRIL